MKTVERIETFDGALHKDERAAKHHLEVKLGDVLLPFAKRIIAAEKYVAITDLIFNESDTLRTILRIKDDMQLEPSDL